MNKQQLASKIWESANRMRSKIEANEYKDYILGFIFYKYLSDQEERWLLEQDYTPEDIKEYANEADQDTVGNVQKSLGYFIAYKDLFSTWIKMGSDFGVDNVHTALSSFTRLIFTSHKKVFEGIFTTLETGLSKLGENTKAQTKAVSDLIHLINDIPMNGRQDYDVLGFIYEYLIGQFAANAGKKAGEFYTPHEVSLLMSEIVADHLKGKDPIEIYDPTSGSGSLLINIGHAIAKYLDNPDHIGYYAQELKANTYNLTRMNLVMRGILPANIHVRNGDTLEDDWPLFDDADPVGSYKLLPVDAVVSNPPYSQRWDPSNKENDPRYARYGMAPKSKADYAFLLHDLYHLKPDGIMTIVLPHGVLFRGGEEGEIRKNLIEYNHIDAIIGLPANIFYGTGIPTIIMVLKQKRAQTDVLIIDASQGYMKEGKNNKLRACDIRKIVDTVSNRSDVLKYARKVSREEIRANDYNLNIPRYVDTSETAESWDLGASMFGGIPQNELSQLDDYWHVFPSLKETLFSNEGRYARIQVEDLKRTIKSNSDVKAFFKRYAKIFSDFKTILVHQLIDQAGSLSIAKTEEAISNEIFDRFKTIELVDPYEAYEIFKTHYNGITGDLELIQTEGAKALRQVDPNMIVKKKNGREQEVQAGWKGHILPFDLVQKKILIEETNDLSTENNRLVEIKEEKKEIIDTFGEEEKQNLLNDDNSDFYSQRLNEEIKNILQGIDSEEIQILQHYLSLTKKKEKEEYVKRNPIQEWTVMKTNKDGTTYGINVVKAAIQDITKRFKFPPNSYEENVVKADKLMKEEKQLKKDIKQAEADLHIKTKNTIETLTDDQVHALLEAKWLDPICDGIAALPKQLMNDFIKKVQALSEKYTDTFFDLESEIQETQKSLSAMLSDLTGSPEEMAGIREWQKLLGGEA